MNKTMLGRMVMPLVALLAPGVPASAQVEITGSYSIRMYDDYI